MIFFCINRVFRKYTSKLTAIEEDSAQEKAKDVFERYFELENILNIRSEPHFFKFDKVVSTSQDAEEAAVKIREDWNLGGDSIPDVVEMLEDKGYKVIEIDAVAPFDGFKANHRCSL